MEYLVHMVNCRRNSNRKAKMVHYQHVGPIGQYHMPKDPRFRFDKETRAVVSLVPSA